MMTTLPGACFSKPGSTGLPLFGVDIAVVQGRQRRVQGRTRAASSSSSSRGRRWLRTLWGDDERFREAYWSRDARRVLHGRRRAPRRGRLLLGRRPHRRRAQRRRPSHRHRRDRERARQPSRPSPRPPPSAGPTISRARRSSCSSPLKQGFTADKDAQGLARASTSTRRSESSRGPTRSASPTRCRRRAPARSCAASSRTSPPARETKGDTSTLEDLVGPREAPRRRGLSSAMPGLDSSGRSKPVSAACAAAPLGRGAARQHREEGPLDASWSSSPSWGRCSTAPSYEAPSEQDDRPPRPGESDTDSTDD